MGIECGGKYRIHKGALSHIGASENTDKACAHIFPCNVGLFFDNFGFYGHCINCKRLSGKVGDGFVLFGNFFFEKLFIKPVKAPKIPITPSETPDINKRFLSFFSSFSVNFSGIFT